MPKGQDHKIINPKSLDDYLEIMTKVVFQTGISWQVVEAKWPDIKRALDGFNTKAISKIDERHLDKLVKDPRVVRNRRKLEAIITNANRLIELEKEHGSFKNYLRSQKNFEETVKMLRKDFKFMGDTGSYYFLYVVGEKVPPHDKWMKDRGIKK